MTETKLGKEHDTSEFLPKKLGYKIQNTIYNDTHGVVQWVEVNLKNQNKNVY